MGIMDYRLAAISVEPQQAAQAAAALGIPLDGAPVAEAQQVWLIGADRSADLTQALTSRCAAIIEYADGAQPQERLAQALGQGQLLVSLTTKLAWTLDTAAQFCDGLIARGLMPAHIRQEVELSLHEAIINAVLHGNLGMAGSLVDEPAQFDAFCQRLTEALADPARAVKRVDLAAWVADGQLHVSVSDAGAGYDPDNIRPPTNPEAKSGRGLEIMRLMSAGLTVSDGGRTATLHFAI